MLNVVAYWQCLHARPAALPTQAVGFGETLLLLASCDNASRGQVAAAVTALPHTQRAVAGGADQEQPCCSPAIGGGGGGGRIAADKRHQRQVCDGAGVTLCGERRVKGLIS